VDDSSHIAGVVAKNTCHGSCLISVPEAYSLCTAICKKTTVFSLTYTECGVLCSPIDFHLWYSLNFSDPVGCGIAGEPGNYTCFILIYEIILEM
jgi:hypothetical protein